MCLACVFADDRLIDSFRLIGLALYGALNPDEDSDLVIKLISFESNLEGDVFTYKFQAPRAPTDEDISSFAARVAKLLGKSDVTEYHIRYVSLNNNHFVYVTIDRKEK